MDRIELITLEDPYRFHDWMTAHPERIQFLMDIMFIMRNQYPDTELIVSLDPSDDDVVLVEPSGLAEPYRFRVSEHCAIDERVQSYRTSASYCDFLRRYRDWRSQYQAWTCSYSDFTRRYEDWCRQFQVWIHSYSDYMTRLKQIVPKDEYERTMHREWRTQ